MGAARLHLVRHGRPDMRAGVAAEHWRLHPQADVDAVATLLPPGATWYSSPAPKALGTARLLTDEAPVVVDDLREARRDATWIADEQRFVHLVRSALLRPDDQVLAGWEPLSRTRSRVLAAVLALPPHDDVVLVGHGTAWTLLVAALTAEPVDVESWQRMRMPDLAVLERAGDGYVLRRGFGT